MSSPRPLALTLGYRKTIIFFDEIHRFNKAQQVSEPTHATPLSNIPDFCRRTCSSRTSNKDTFRLVSKQFRSETHSVGASTVDWCYDGESFVQAERCPLEPVSVGPYTTHPINPALIPHSVFVFERLTEPDIERIVLQGVRRVSQADIKPFDIDETNRDDVFSDPVISSSQPTSSSQHSGVEKTLPQLSPKLLASLVSLADGDARTALSLLALVLGSSPDTDEATLLTALRQSVSTSYDRTGDSHYDMISALHKSVRGSEGSAAMYWLARMLTAGEDPVFVARRMVVCASEDIGLADNAALPLVSGRSFLTLGVRPELASGGCDTTSVPKRRYARMPNKPGSSRSIPL